MSLYTTVWRSELYKEEILLKTEGKRTVMRVNVQILFNEGNVMIGKNSTQSENWRGGN